MTEEPAEKKPRITRRTVALGVVVLLLAVAAGAVYLWGGSGKPLELYAQTRTSLNTPTGGFALVEFALNQQCELKSIKVAEMLGKETPGEPIWHVVGDPKSSPLTNVTYGTRVPNMTKHASLADAPRVRLLPGKTYWAQFDVAGHGTVETIFTTDPASNQ